MGKKIRPFTPWRNARGELIWVARGFPEPHPLYGLHLLAADPHKPVLVVEGEKAAEAARLIPEIKDYVVVTWPGGANSVSKADWMPLKGRIVKIWPDNDDAGRKAAHEIKKILEGLNICK